MAGLLGAVPIVVELLADVPHKAPEALSIVIEPSELIW